MQPQQRLIFFRRLCILGACLAFTVVVLGAWVRLNAAGLGCPDWPGCYGHLTVSAAAEHLSTAQQAYPERPFEATKASKEMLHRYFASSLGVLILLLCILAWRNRDDLQQPLLLPSVLAGLVILQGLLGMWTVTLLLKPLIVVLHLIGGLSTLALLTWLALGRTSRIAMQRTAMHNLTLIGMLVLGLQIFLGGWTSSNYAAVSCPDFPTCQNSYWPQMDVRDAFVLWRGLGIDYEGGILEHPARIAIHFIHRLGALMTALFLGVVGLLAIRNTQPQRVRLAGAAVTSVLIAQLIVGPAMVITGFPLLLATAHNAIAALLLLALLWLSHAVRISLTHQ